MMGLWLLDGLEEGAARAAVKADWGPAAAVVFDRLLRALPAALQARDKHGVIARWSSSACALWLLRMSSICSASSEN